jgi:hypothetical protein
MVRIVLPKNESVEIVLDGADGGFQVSYGKAKVIVRETQHLPDDKNRHGVLYEHRYVNKDGTSVIPSGDVAVESPPASPDLPLDDNTVATS